MTVPTRPRLHREVLDRRVHVVTAGPGFGKSTLITDWAERVPSVVVALGPVHRSTGTLARTLLDGFRLRVPALGPPLGTVVAALADGAPDPTALAAEFGELLQAHLARDVALVLDNVEELEGSEAALLVDALIRHAPDRLHFVLAGRAEPPVRLSRLRVAGEVEDLDAGDLAFTPGETADILAHELGEAGSQLADRVQAATSGWPVAVRLVCETMRRAASKDAARVLDPIRHPGGTLFSYLAEEVLATESVPARRVLEDAALVGGMDPRLATALGIADATTVLDTLRSRGLYFDEHEEPLRLTPLVAGHLTMTSSFTETERRRVLGEGVTWHLAQARWVEALTLLRDLADPELVTSTVLAHATAMLDGGAANALIETVETVPAVRRSADLERVHAEAYRLTGHGDHALEILTRLAGDDDPVDPALAWRIGVIHHLRGELERALAAYGRGAQAGPAGDVAMLLSWHASAVWATADLDRSRALAERALDAAREANDDRAFGAAHTVMAMVAALAGDRSGNEAHYLRALEHAERAGDLWQQMRIHTNRGSRHEEEGSYAESIAETEQALRLAELTDDGAFEALALLNRGQARLHLGAVDEAAADFAAARLRWDAIGSRHSAYASAALGDVHRIRGDRAQAVAAYRSALTTSEPEGDVQGLVPALVGLSRALLDDDPDEALVLARRAVAHAAALDVTDAHLALGRALLARGDRTGARAEAETAVDLAGARRDRRGLARGLELSAECAGPGVGAGADPRLDEALRLWRELGDPLGELVNRLTRARLGGSAPDEIADIVETASRLGARGLVAAARDLDGHDGPPPAVRIRTLGGFGVDLDGEPVPLTAWQSKKARDLLKILLAHRGRAVHREMLMEALWPGGPPARTSNRLSVALSTLRAVLDPGGRHADPVVHADRTSVRLDLGVAAVDVELFLADAAAGLERFQAGDPRGARALLLRAETAYLGDVLPEDAYDESVGRLRDEARTAFMSTSRALARLAADAGDHDAAARHHQRLLAVDPYDEAASLGLVGALTRAGLHGEARRVYGQYAGRMTELGLEPAAFPATVAAARRP
jgi:ATP/maltotriose-dependent transcriptional regulator MalT/DNA-binding SARP family transcriptional activator